jgi:hypothetical protein
VLEVLGDGAWAHAEGARDGLVGAPARGKLQDPCLTVGQVGHAVGLSGPQGEARALPIARPPLRVAERCADRVQQVAVVLGKVPARTVQRDSREPAVSGVGQIERNLVLHWNMPKEL